MNTPVDMSKPCVSSRRITQIHFHHDGGGDEFDDAEDIKHDAMSRTDQSFSDIPYNFVINRRLVPQDAVDAPIDNQWQVLTGRDIERMPASIKGHNEGAVAIVIAGRWDNQPLPSFAEDVAIELALWLCKSFKLTADDIFGHKELAPPGYTVCPGYDVARIRCVVAARLPVLY